MKKNDWLLLLATASFSYLFYEQYAGINFLLFTLLLLVLLVLQTSREVMQEISWRLVIFASILTAVNVVVLNTGLAVMLNCFSLILVAGFSRVPKGSIFIVALHSLYSLVASFVKSMVNRVVPETQEQGGNAYSFSAVGRQHVYMVGLPLMVFFVFLLMYRNASVGFDHVVSYLNFDFISWDWVWFTFLGGYLLVGFFRPILLQSLADLDENAPNQLRRVRQIGKKVQLLMGLKYEYKAAFLLLVLLNLLLLVFILSDAYYVFIGDLPDGQKYSDFLHQGVYTLIFTILMAIGILLYFFRGNLNFYRKSKPLKHLAYLWLGLNLLLVFLTITKNSIYITGTGLTYKRIGVYTYLLLTGIGLIISYVKIHQEKTNWYLFRKNAWAVYLVLMLMSTLNWDRILTRYNLAYAQSPDLGYLLTLSESNLPILYAQAKAPTRAFTPNQLIRIVSWRNDFLTQTEERDWQSWNYNDWRIRKELQ